MDAINHYTPGLAAAVLWLLAMWVASSDWD